MSVISIFEAARPGDGAALAEGATPAQVQEGAARRPHVCFVAPMNWPVMARDARVNVVGGAEVQQAFIARGLARAGYRVSMICLDYGQAEYERIDGVAMHKSFRLEAGIPGLRFLPRLASWWKAMRTVDADVYYQRSSSMLTGVMDAFCRRHGKRSIFAAASDRDFTPGEEPSLGNARDQFLYRRGLRRVDRIVVQNLAQQAECLRRYGRESTYVPSCYEVPPGHGRGAGETVLWVANMREGKRPHLLLDIAQRLPHRRFVMAGGDGSGNPADERRYREVAERARALPNVTLTGFVPLAEAEALFDDARVVVNTSSFEGMPNTFLQAWARGVPTLAFIDLGARVDGEPLYEVATDAVQAAAQIERHFTDAAYHERESRRSLAYFESTHSLGRVIGVYSGLLDELHAAARGTR